MIGHIVFTEIPAADPERAAAFYEILLQGPLTRNDQGPNPIWMFPHAEGGHAAELRFVADFVGAVRGRRGAGAPS